MSRLFWSTAAITILSACISFGYSLLAVTPHGASDVYALYALSRSIALLVAIVFFVWRRSVSALTTLALAMSLVQLIDAWIGSLQHDPAKTFGPLAFGIVNFALFLLLFRGRSTDRPGGLA